MSGKWLIHHGAERLGPWDPAEVRRALRDGRIDPFDLVSREGSQVKLELINVDEIFAPQKSDPAPTAVIPAAKKGEAAVSDLARTRTQARASKPVAPAALADTVTDDGKTGRRPAAAPVPESAKNQESAAEASAVRPADPAAEKKPRRKDAKRYFLHDRKKRVLGPLSAREIQSLFYRGIVDQSVKVAKDPKSKPIPVAQFIAAYAGAKAAHFKSFHTRLDLDTTTNHSDGLPNSRVMEELAQIARYKNAFRSPALPIISTLGILLGLVLAIVAIKYDAFDAQSPFRQWISSKTGPAPEQQPRVEGRAAPPRNKQVPATRALSQPTAPPIANNTITAPPKPPQATASAPKKTAAKVKPKVRPTTKANSSRRQGSLPQGQRPRSETYVPPRRPPVNPAPTTQVRPTTTPAAADTNATGVSGVASLATKVGQVTTIGPLTYSPAAVAACSMKCEILFKDSRGLTVTAVFFKGAHEASLKRNGGRATIAGRVAKRGAGYIVYLESVR